MQISTQSLQARNHLNSHPTNRTAALLALRRKKALEATLTQRSQTLAQLEDTLSKIEDAATQIDVVHALRESTGVLKGLNAQIGDIGDVEEVMDGLRAEVERVDEVNGVLADGSGMVAVDEGEVDDELEALEKEENEKKVAEKVADTARRLAEVASVPVGGEQQGHKVPDAENEKSVDESVEALGRMSLDEEPPKDKASGHGRAAVTAE